MTCDRLVLEYLIKNGPKTTLELQNIFTQFKPASVKDSIRKMLLDKRVERANSVGRGKTSQATEFGKEWLSNPNNFVKQKSRNPEPQAKSLKENKPPKQVVPKKVVTKNTVAKVAHKPAPIVFNKASKTSTLPNTRTAEMEADIQKQIEAILKKQRNKQSKQSTSYDYRSFKDRPIYTGDDWQPPRPDSLTFKAIPSRGI